MFSHRSKSPDLLSNPTKSKERPFSFSTVDSNSHSTRVDVNSHRTIYRTSGLIHRGVDSSSESLSSEHSSRYSLKNKFHTPLRKTKSSGSSDGYAEDEEMEEVVENFESSSSLNTQQSNDNQLTFVWSNKSHVMYAKQKTVSSSSSQVKVPINLNYILAKTVNMVNICVYIAEAAFKATFYLHL